MAMVEDEYLPAPMTPAPLLREHRLYQADWLLRFYGFTAREILDETTPMFHPYLDPKCNWALGHLDVFPFEVNRASEEELLRVPGMGVKSVKRILYARRNSSLDFSDLKRLGVVLKRAKYYITCKGKMAPDVHMDPESMLCDMMSRKDLESYRQKNTRAGRQISFFDAPLPNQEDEIKMISGQL